MSIATIAQIVFFGAFALDYFLTGGSLAIVTAGAAVVAAVVLALGK